RLETGPPPRGLVSGPLVLLIELARGDERRELEEARPDDGLPQVLIELLNGPGGPRTVHRHWRRSAGRHPALAGNVVPDPLAVIVEGGAIERRQPREGRGVDVGRQ